MADRLVGKTVLVTAAGAGIGRAIVLACAAEGARVVATDIDSAALAEIAGVAGVETDRLDVRDEVAIGRLVAKNGPFSTLCNVAGFVHHGTILDCDLAAWELSFDLNVTSMYRMIRAVLPGMLATGGGSISRPATRTPSRISPSNWTRTSSRRTRTRSKTLGTRYRTRPAAGRTRPSNRSAGPENRPKQCCVGRVSRPVR